MRREDVEEIPPQRGSLAATGRAQRMTADDVYRYENIIHIPPKTPYMGGKYIVEVAKEGDFITFTRKGFNLRAQPVKTGWKFHISLDDDDFENVAKGWNIIYKILMKYGVNISKVVQNGVKLAAENEDQRGKQVTIYQHFNPELSWKDIIGEITAELAKEGVKPGYAPPSDRPVRGTNYVYYRNDAAADKIKYKKGTDMPTEPNKEFDDYKIEIEYQPPVKKWEGRNELKLSK